MEQQIADDAAYGFATPADAGDSTANQETPPAWVAGGGFGSIGLPDDVRTAEPVADLAIQRALDADDVLIAFAWPDLGGFMPTAREDFAVPEPAVFQLGARGPAVLVRPQDGSCVDVHGGDAGCATRGSVGT